MAGKPLLTITGCFVCLALLLQKHIKHGEFLWELLYPKDKDGLPGRSASGRYKVKLFILVSTCLALCTGAHCYMSAAA
jgi:hypothetical protein